MQRKNNVYQDEKHIKQIAPSAAHAPATSAASAAALAAPGGLAATRADDDSFDCFLRSLRVDVRIIWIEVDFALECPILLTFQVHEGVLVEVEPPPFPRCHCPTLLGHVPHL